MLHNQHQPALHIGEWDQSIDDDGREKVCADENQDNRPHLIAYQTVKYLSRLID